MIYHLIKALQEWSTSMSWSRLFDYISFRATLAGILALIITILFGARVIRFMQRHQIGDEVRDLGLEGQLKKQGTPTMGGVIILLAILVPTLLFGRLDNIYIILMLVTTIWLGVVGFIDDYIKVFLKYKEGLSGRFKIIGQVGLGLIVAFTMWYSPDIVVREEIQTDQIEVVEGGTTITSADVKSSRTTVPFFKNNILDYESLAGGNKILTLILYVVVATFIVTAVSNGANLTDGLDGLATGVSTPIVAVLGLLAYLSGNVLHADYLNIMYIPNSGELLIFSTAMVGALIGFLWYNSFPAQIFMGDTGSLAIGGIIAVFALCIRVELLLPLLCGVFLIESLSVMMQVGYFKYTKNKYGEGRRIFLISPIHHHYQRKGMFETKIVIRFCIISILMAALAVATLKIR